MYVQHGCVLEAMSVVLESISNSTKIVTNRSARLHANIHGPVIKYRAHLHFGVTNLLCIFNEFANTAIDKIRLLTGVNEFRIESSLAYIKIHANLADSPVYSIHRHLLADSRKRTYRVLYENRHSRRKV